jgi:putative membrane protein
MQLPAKISDLAWWCVLGLAVLQCAFMLAEMFFWPFMGRHVALYSGTVTDATRGLGANMGLYNGFLAAGLVWSLLAPPKLQITLALFFVGCILVAGLFAGPTVNWNVTVAQGIPALFAMVVLFRG